MMSPLNKSSNRQSLNHLGEHTTSYNTRTNLQ